MTTNRKPLYWIGSSLKDLKWFPDEVKDVVGHALDTAQFGGKHIDAKPLSGFGGAGVLEIVESFEGNAYRAVYTVKFETAVYVLHAFQKKSKQGIKTPQAEIDLIQERLKKAEEDYESRKNKKGSR